MKILYLNIYEGCIEPDRFQRLINFVKRENPDVLGLSELNKWEENDFAKLKEFQKQVALPFVAFCKSWRGYHLGLFSKLQLENQYTTSQGFKNGLVKAEIKEKRLTIILTHLSYYTEDERLAEIKLVQPLLNKKTILIGDFNSLSPLDSYNEAEIVAELAKRGGTRFGTGKLRREAISKIMKMGFVDCVRKFENFQHSVPTLLPKQEDSKNIVTDFRVDYVFVSSDLENKLQNAKIIRNKETDYLSDHYPVVAELKI